MIVVYKGCNGQVDVDLKFVFDVVHVDIVSFSFFVVGHHLIYHGIRVDVLKGVVAAFGDASFPIHDRGPKDVVCPKRVGRFM